MEAIHKQPECDSGATFKDSLQIVRLCSDQSGFQVWAGKVKKTLTDCLADCSPWEGIEREKNGGGRDMRGERMRQRKGRQG